MRLSTLAPAHRARLVRAAAAAALAIGYIDLIRGGVTLAPICLVLGYVILIPMAILT